MLDGRVAALSSVRKETAYQSEQLRESTGLEPLREGQDGRGARLPQSAVLRVDVEIVQGDQVSRLGVGAMRPLGYRA